MPAASPIEAIVGSLRGDDPESLGAPEWDASFTDRVVALSMQHLVAPAIHQALGERLHGDAGRALALAHGRNAIRQLDCLADLARLSAVLKDLDADWGVLKGPALGEVYYPRPEARSYADLDVLVDPARFGEVLAALEAAEARLLDVNWDRIRGSGRGELSLRLWHGTELDLHWHPITEVSIRDRFPVTTGDLLERTELHDLGGVEVPILGAGDQLSYVSTHAVLAGADRLRWYVDVAMILDGDGVPSAEDWDRADRLGFAIPQAVMLDRVARVLRHKLAEQARRTAPRSVWRGVMRVSAVIRPPERLVDRHLGLRTLAQSTRSTSGQSLAGAREWLWRGVLKPVATEPDHPWRARLSRTRPAAKGAHPLAAPAGTAHDRAAYLHWVSAQGQPGTLDE